MHAARWGVIALVLAALFARTLGRRGGPGGERPATAIALKTLGRSQVGVRQLPAELPPMTAADFHRAFDRQVSTDAERLLLVPLAGELLGRDEALRRLDALEGPDAPLLRRVYEGPPLDDRERERLRGRLGWSGELALVYGLPDGDEARVALLDDARRFALTLAAVSLAAVLLGVAALVLFAIACYRIARRRLTTLDRPAPPGPLDMAWLETPALLLLGVLLTQNLWVLALVPLWPRLRGMRWREWREGLGLVRGRGILAEAGLGAVGYLASLPLIAASMFLTMALARWTGSEMSHPYVEEALREGDAGMLFLGACLWAPLIEEMVFRGALWRYVRTRSGVALSAFVTGLLFALAHPQGIAALPTLTALGALFALLRHWRGTLVAPIAAHALHNGMLVGLLHLVA